MTFTDAIKANPTFYDVPLELIELAFLNRGVLSTDDYTATDDEKKSLELVSADIYMEMVTQPEFREGDLAIKYNRSVLSSRARAIYTKYEDPKLEEMGTPINLNIRKK